MKDINFDLKKFNTKISKFTSKIKSFYSASNQIDFCVLFCDSLKNFKNENLKNLNYAKFSMSNAFLIWLLSFAIDDCVLVYSFSNSTFYVFSDENSYKYLESFNSTNDIKFSIENFDSFKTFLNNNENKKVLTIKEKFNSENFRKLIDFLTEKNSIVENKNIFENLLSIKNNNEVENIKNAAKLTSLIYRLSVVKEIEVIFDEDIETSHKFLSRTIEKLIRSPSKFKIDTDPENIESCYPPLIQSGGDYNLKLFSVSNSKNLDVSKYASVIVSFGVRNKFYCSNISRTLLFNPSSKQKEQYNIMCVVFDFLKQNLKSGNILKDIWKGAMSKLEEKCPEDKKYFGKNFGYGIGIQIKEPYLIINSNNDAEVKENMVFNVSVKFKDPKNTMIISDTVLVTEKQTENLTDSNYDLDKILYEFEKDELSENEVIKEEIKEEKLEKNITGVKRRRTRVSDNVIKLKEDQESRKKQLDLLDKRIKIALSKEPDKKKKKEEIIYESYENASKIPNCPLPYKVHVHQSADTLLLPIFDVYYPVHVNFVKNVQISNSSYQSTLHISFNPHLTDKNNKAFIKEISFNSKNKSNFEKVSTGIKMIKKKLESQKDSLINQIEMNNKRLLTIKEKLKIPRICNLKVRPSLGGKRSSIGVLEAHKNGFLFILNYSKMKPIKIPIFYENIKHAFFQPANNTASILLHFNLYAPLDTAFKTKDIQFYIDVVESSTNIEKIHQGDQDGIREEQREIFYKNKLNKLFKQFVRSSIKIAKLNGEKINFEIPYKNLKFNGVPNRSSVNIYPTLNCLVSFEEYPSFILSLKDVEVAHFERVQFQLRQFDLVFVYKDLENYKHICAIPNEYLDQLRKFLNDANIIHFTGSVNLDWDKILKEINSDLKAFWSNGGWKFLDVRAESEEEEISESRDESFRPSSEEDEQDESYSTSEESE